MQAFTVIANTVILFIQTPIICRPPDVSRRIVLNCAGRYSHLKNRMANKVQTTSQPPRMAKSNINQAG